MSIESALALIESVKDYRVLFVGDDIVDEYHYVSMLGKSPKEPIIPMLYLEKEVFHVGVEAAANHARSFCAKVDVCKSSTAVRKVRFVDRNYMRKLAEVHYDEVVVRNDCLQGDYDVHVVTDFGHDRVTKEMVAALCKKPFLSA